MFKTNDIHALFTPRKCVNFGRLKELNVKRFEDTSSFWGIVQISSSSDMIRFYTFHQQFTHNTDDYCTMKNRIKDLIEKRRFDDPDTQPRPCQGG